MSFAPIHEYSNLIDDNFTNKIQYPSKTNIVNMVQFSKCNGDIMLEPRLQEYIKKKQYYRDNNIQSCIPLEKEYQITQYDIDMLKSFRHGKRDMYEHNNKYTKKFMNDNKYNKNQKFKSTELLNDKRVSNIEKISHNFEQPINRGIFNNDGQFYDDNLKTRSDLHIDLRDMGMAPKNSRQDKKDGKYRNRNNYC